MPRKFTANGTFIPQDAADNDMCILFMKYGRCRFKTKCKKSHWVPPLPDNPYPVEIKPPLPIDDVLIEKVRIKIRNLKDSSNDTQKELLESNSQHCATSTEIIDFKVSSKADISKQTNSCMLPKRFKYVFHDKCDNLIAKNAGVSRLFNEAGAYFDNVTQKLQICEPPENKIEKRHLKVLRRIHWRNTQSLKEKLSQYPPSYNLVFDRSKINFARLQPYVYVLIHECMCVGGEKKSVKPSSFEYLIADTLLAYVDSKCITPQEAEEKLQQWGARAVRARQCITHLWHILAISSKSPDGCAKDVIRIEEEVIQGTRTSLDYACVCAFASKREARVGPVPLSTYSKVDTRQNAEAPVEHKRKRSRQFKNVPFNERKKMKTRLFIAMADIEMLLSVATCRCDVEPSKMKPSYRWLTIICCTTMLSEAHLDALFPNCFGIMSGLIM
ncbi:uncharacterized protein LOC113677719, partial [Paramuricea clavata]